MNAYGHGISETTTTYTILKPNTLKLLNHDNTHIPNAVSIVNNTPMKYAELWDTAPDLDETWLKNACQFKESISVSSYHNVTTTSTALTSAYIWEDMSKISFNVQKPFFYAYGYAPMLIDESIKY